MKGLGIADEATIVENGIFKWGLSHLLYANGSLVFGRNITSILLEAFLRLSNEMPLHHHSERLVLRQITIIFSTRTMQAWATLYDLFVENSWSQMGSKWVLRLKIITIPDWQDLPFRNKKHYIVLFLAAAD